MRLKINWVWFLVLMIVIFWVLLEFSGRFWFFRLFFVFFRLMVIWVGCLIVYFVGFGGCLLKVNFIFSWFSGSDEKDMFFSVIVLVRLDNNLKVIMLMNILSFLNIVSFGFKFFCLCMVLLLFILLFFSFFFCLVLGSVDV